MVEVYYSPREDPNSISGENSNWEGKPDYAQNGLASFLGNKEGRNPWKTKKGGTNSMIAFKKSKNMHTKGSHSLSIKGNTTNSSTCHPSFHVLPF